MASRWREFLWKRGNDWWGFLHRVAGRGENEGNLELYPAWGRITVLASGLAVIGYFSLATGIWVYMHNTRGYASIGWNDVAWPWNWRQMRSKQGNELINSVDKLFQMQRFQQGIFNLVAGVRLAPDNLEGRAMLAAIQAELGRKDLSADTLAEGLEHATDNIEFVGAVFAAHLSNQREERVVELARAWFERKDRDSQTDLVVVFAYATALGNLRHPDEAVRVIIRTGLTSNDTGAALIAQILWQNDRREDALRILEGAVEQFPESDILMVRLAQYQKDSGRTSAAEITLASRALTNLDAYAPALDLIWWYVDQGKERDRDNAIESYLRRFSHDEAAVAAFITGASARGLVPLVERLADIARSSDWNSPVFSLTRVEALVAAKRHAEASRLMDDIQKSKAPWLADFENALTGYGAVANLAGGNPIQGETLFIKMMGRPRITALELITIGKRFVDADLDRYARRVFVRALELDPGNTLALAALIDLEVRERNSDAVPEIVDRLLERRRPALSSLNQVRDALRSDFATFVLDREARLERIESRAADLLKPQPLPPAPRSQEKQS